jgi:multidrug resistance efflux pump
VAEATLAAAEQLLAEPISLKARLAEAEAQLAKIETELAPWAAMCLAARTRREFAEKELASKRSAGEAVPAIVVQKAESELKVAAAQADELTAKQAALEQERATLAKLRGVLARQLELKIDEERAVAEGRAQVDAANAQVEQAEAALAVAQLGLDRMVIRAPVAGKVLDLVARPGTKLMGLAPASMADASTVITMYDPASLQVGADVRLEDVPESSSGSGSRSRRPRPASRSRAR